MHRSTQESSKCVRDMINVSNVSGVHISVFEVFGDAAPHASSSRAVTINRAHDDGQRSAQPPKVHFVSVYAPLLSFFPRVKSHSLQESRLAPEELQRRARFWAIPQPTTSPPCFRTCYAVAVIPALSLFASLGSRRRPLCSNWIC